MNKHGTGGQTWPLTSPLDNPTFAAGGQVRFDMNDVPDRCPTGPLAYFVPALILTFFVSLVNAGESPTPVPWYMLPAALIKSVEVRNAWHGTPVSATNVLGEHLRIVEFCGGGYRYSDRFPSAVTPAASAGEPIVFKVRVPLSAKYGDLVKDTSQLALLYQPASIEVVFKDASVLDGISSGTTIASGNVRCSAELDPRQEIVLGTGVEWILHRTVATPQGSEIQIKGFGRDTKLTGVQPKGGVFALMELTDQVLQGGVIQTSVDLTQFAFDWRGQKITKDLRAYLSQILQQLPNDRPQYPAPPGGANATDFNTFPYAEHGADSAFDNQKNLLAWIMALAGDDCRLTDLQTGARDETYHLEESDGFASGDHLILAQYAKQWTDGKRADFEAQVTKGGASSLAAYVLGSGYAGAKLRPRQPLNKHVLTADQVAYLPWQFI